MDALVAAVRALQQPANASPAAAAEDVHVEIDTARPQQSLQRQPPPPTPRFEAITAEQQVNVLPFLQEVNVQFESQCTASQLADRARCDSTTFAFTHSGAPFSHI
jgi:hypothetical protein